MDLRYGTARRVPTHGRRFEDRTIELQANIFRVYEKGKWCGTSCVKDTYDLRGSVVFIPDILIIPVLSTYPISHSESTKLKMYRPSGILQSYLLFGWKRWCFPPCVKMQRHGAAKRSGTAVERFRALAFLCLQQHHNNSSRS
jgi:hypothetical protein